MKHRATFGNIAEALATSIDAATPRPSRAEGGSPPYPTVLMVKILVLRQPCNLADDALEYQLLDRRSFLQFLDLTESSNIPDAKTICCFATAWLKPVPERSCSSKSSGSCSSTAI